MAEPRLIDYYAILNLPPTADLVGIENAYARLSNELAYRADVDASSVEALERANEAYAVLSKPNLRLEYDRMLFKKVLDQEKHQVADAARRKQLPARILFGVLAVLVGAQLISLVYIGRDQAAAAVGTMLRAFGM